MTPRRSRCYRCVYLTRSYGSRYCQKNHWILARNQRIPGACGSRCKFYKRGRGARP